jgi:hypothetical protein
MQLMAAEAMEQSSESEFKREILTPAECRKLAPDLAQEVSLYRYRSLTKPWVLCIGTCGEPKSGKLSLGGFRIVPEARAATKDFSPEREAIGLATGMDEKVYWSRVIRVGGPQGLKNLDRVVGGKCVLLPGSDSRVGQVNDIKMLDFAIAAMLDFEQHSGIFLTTGQDLGHGVLSDGKTTSLEYLNQHFHGSVLADTSEPTAEGNLYSLLGMLKGAGIDPSAANIGLIGYGNIGKHLVQRLEEVLGSSLLQRLFVVEFNASRRQELARRGVRVFSPEEKGTLLALGIDALVVNANGGTLDSKTVDQVIHNPRLKVICGCENLVMPDHKDAERLQKAGRLYCPTELCGMMGYLTAVEEYLSKRTGTLEMKAMLEAAKRLEEACEHGARRAFKAGAELSFEAAMRAEFDKKG